MTCTNVDGVEMAARSQLRLLLRLIDAGASGASASPAGDCVAYAPSSGSICCENYMLVA